MIRTTGYLFWRLCRIIGGFVLLVLGLLLSLPGVPGPGIVLLVLGIGILSRDFHWAEKTHAYLKRVWRETLNRRNSVPARRESDHG
jgi:uncharacterized membrane protein